MVERILGKESQTILFAPLVITSNENVWVKDVQQTPEIHNGMFQVPANYKKKRLNLGCGKRLPINAFFLCVI